MSNKLWRWIYLFATCLMILILVACLPDTSSSSDESIQIPTQKASSTQIAEESDRVTQGLSTATPPSPDIQQEGESPPTGNAIVAEGTTPAPEIVDSETRDAIASEYRVVFVEDDDVLNIRRGPGVEFRNVGQIQPGDRGVKVTGPGQVVIDSLWLPVEYEDVSGWVNGRFLTEVISQEDFCGDEDVEELVNMAYEAFVNQDGDRLSQLVPEGRSLRFRRHWWNPEVNFDKDEVANLFESERSYSWGIADGSGNLIEGSFSEVILPILERNLKAHTERSCNEILHGGTAGLGQLPPSYNGINYYSFYRPAGPDEFELDWGSWIMGIEVWQDQPYLSYMVHFEWEI